MQLVIFSLYLILHVGVQTFDVTGWKILEWDYVFIDIGYALTRTKTQAIFGSCAKKIFKDTYLKY